MTDSLFLDDLHIGQRFSSGSHVLQANDIKRFAGEFDPQPFHLDEAAAAMSLFAGLVASGWHTAALTMRLLVGGGAPIAGGIIGASGEISWPKPTRPGDELHVVSEGLGATICQATESGDLAMLTAAVFIMASLVVALNRLFWQPLFDYAARLSA